MRPAYRALAIGLLVLAALLAVSYVLRDPLATAILAFKLDRDPDMHCTKPEVKISAAFDNVHIGPLECRREVGPMRYFAAKSGMDVRLHHFSAERVQLSAAEVDMRERDVSHVEMGSFGSELSKIAGLSDSLIKGNLDSRDMYSNDSPPVSIDTVRVSRAGKLEAVMHGFEKSTDGRWDRTFAKTVEMPGAGDLMAIQAFDVRVTEARAQMSAAVYLGGKPKPGATPDIRLKVSGARLESAAPRFEIRLET